MRQLLMIAHPERIAWVAAGGAALLYAAARALNWWRHRAPDDAIDRLIASNRPQSAERKRPDWQGVDWSKLNRLGERRWQDTLRGQRRQQKPSESNLRRFDRTG